MESIHNLNTFQSSTGVGTCGPQHQNYESSSPTLNSSTNSNDYFMKRSPLNCNSGSKSLYMTSDNNNHNNFLRIPEEGADAVSAPSSPSIHDQSFFNSLSCSSPPPSILPNKSSTGFTGYVNNNELSIKIVETDPLEKRFVIYRVEVALNGQKWFVRRRYSEFHRLLEAVSIQISQKYTSLVILPL